MVSQVLVHRAWKVTAAGAWQSWPHGILSQDTGEAEEEECDVFGPGSPAWRMLLPQLKRFSSHPLR